MQANARRWATLALGRVAAVLLAGGLKAWHALCRLANSVTHDIHKLPFRGTISNGEVKVEQTKMGHSPPIWFVFSGAALLLRATRASCLAPCALRPAHIGTGADLSGNGQTCSHPHDPLLNTQHVSTPGPALWCAQSLTNLFGWHGRVCRHSCVQALLHCREAGTPRE